VIAFTTGRGAPQGFPFVPVVKITGNRVTWNKLRDHMDVDVSAVIEGKESLPEAGKRIFREMLAVCSVGVIDLRVWGRLNYKFLFANTTDVIVL
jgi:altronate dehydratase large subunit